MKSHSDLNIKANQLDFPSNPSVWAEVVGQYRGTPDHDSVINDTMLPPGCF